jgi:long-chain fatty acid transport protein
LLVSLSFFSSFTQASDFSLPFINASDLGTAYSGWAAVAEDASTAYSNPAGLTRLCHTQLVFPVLGLFGYTKFTGVTETPAFTYPTPTILEGAAASTLKALMPSFYLSIPITKRLTFAFNQTNPFGLGSNYRKTSIVRYLSTKSKVAVIDVGPSLGFKVTEQLSVGAGFDAQYLMFTLNHLFGPPFSIPADSEQKNNETGWGYGWHSGVLYELPCARVGLSYNSRVWFHTKGDSILYVPPIPEKFRSGRLRSDAPLPERAQASVYIEVTPQFALMSTLYYTHWRVFNQLKLRRTIFFGGEQTDVTIPFGYHDTLDLSAGATYQATRKWLFRTGFQIMTTPSRNQFRAVADPIGPAVIVAVGTRYQQNACLSYDVGYGHSFFIHQSVQLNSDITSAFGRTKAESNILGIQINWNIT